MKAWWLLASPQDPLAQAVAAAARRCGLGLHWHTRAALPPALSVLWHGQLRLAQAQLSGQVVNLLHLAGVLFRPGPAWARGWHFASREAAFIHHEQRAAWSALLSNLPVPVLHRAPAAWFVDPALRAAQLGQLCAPEMEPALAALSRQGSVRSGAADAGAAHTGPARMRLLCSAAGCWATSGATPAPRRLRLPPEAHCVLLTSLRQQGLHWAELSLAWSSGWRVEAVNAFPSGRAWALLGERALRRQAQAVLECGQ
jgi:hypothetical protein